MPTRRQESLLRSSVRARRGEITAGAVLALLHQVCEATVAILIGVLVDEAIATADGTALALWTAALVAVFVVLALAGLYGYYLLTRAEGHIAHAVRVRLAARVVDPGGGTDAAARPGEVLSLATSDAGRLGSVAHVVGGAVSASAVLVGGGAYLLATSWRLGAVVLLGLPVLLWLSQRLAAPLERRSAAEQEAVADASGLATDLISGLRVLKGLGAGAAAAARYREVSAAARDRRIAAARYAGLAEGTVLALTGVFAVVVAWLGGRLALGGTISVGELVAAVGLAGFLVGPLDRLASLPSDLAVVRASAVRLATFLDTAPGVADGDRALPSSPTPRELVLRGVHSGTLRGVDLAVAPGTCLGVVAADRGDAISLLDLFARRVDPSDGEVRYGGVPLHGLRLPVLRAAVLVSEHGAVLFDGTVADNLGAAGSRADDVLAASAADEVVAALPDGDRTRVGERGRRLSGGQRQRVALARALAADPEVLVLHDPTTAIDAATEHRIAVRLPAVRAGRTTLLVTTSPALLAACDRVVVVRDGELAADSVHAELAETDAGYRRDVLA